MKMSLLPSLATAHLVLRLQPVNRALRAAVESQKIAASRLTRPDLSPLCLTEEHIQVLLEQVDVTQSGSALPGFPATLTQEERITEEELRAQAADIHCALPLDQLSQKLGLTAFEQESVLLCAAPNLDSTYERIYAFVLDDLNRRYPCVELLISLTSASIEERLAQRHLLSSFGRLRRFGILLPFGDPPTELRQEFRLAPGVFEYLTGASGDMSRLCRDRSEVPVPCEIEPPPQVTQKEFAHLGESIEEGRISILGIWGRRQNGAEEFVLALSAAIQRPLRRLSLFDLERTG